MTQTTQNEEILENDSATVTDATEEEVVAEASEIPSADTNDAEKIKKLTDALARATADYQNLLKRSESERREMAAFFTESFVKKILPTLDNLDRVVSGTPAELQNWAVYEGVKHAATGLSRVLEGMWVSAFESLGKELDPSLHEAMSQGPGPAGQIISEFEKGYRLSDKVIRHAKVVVGTGE